MKKISITILAGIYLSMSSLAWSYDTRMAKSYAELFKPVVGAKAGKGLHLIPPAVFVKKVKEGKEYMALDVRTPAETRFFGMTLPDSLIIPAGQLFRAENLARIPTDKPVIIICQLGGRSIATGTALRHIGFDNVYILKGGLKGLSTFLGPKQANKKPSSAKGSTVR